jgi:hypothetical protein
MITTTPLRQTTTPVMQAIGLVRGCIAHVCFGEVLAVMAGDHSVVIDGTNAVMSGGHSPVPDETRLDSPVPDETRVDSPVTDETRVSCTAMHLIPDPEGGRSRNAGVSCFDCFTAYSERPRFPATGASAIRTSGRADVRSAPHYGRSAGMRSCTTLGLGSKPKRFAV